jgi:hypothetical protein
MTLTSFKSYIKVNFDFGQQKKLKHENNRVKQQQLLPITN